ncbi:UV-B-induced protein, chloroplastic [Vitis vinifera]|uniref:UV-B-induced protein, chloroplastic n=1 Tax=Vitis vinifera TaxID=29760 RepID=A0A438FTX3_VITVI|nr:UV-B-induced protein, chloroplastic [Vitis vinifera]
MEAAIATVVPSSLGFSRATISSHSRPGHRKMASGWKEQTMVRASATVDNDSYESQLQSPHFAWNLQLLEQFQTDRDAEGHKQESSASGIELLLYRRIAKVKANERKKALEEILYVLVVQKFGPWELHSPEATEMIQNHLAFILGNRFGDSTSVAKMSKLRVGQVYAASVMYGYFLKRVDERFQLEKTMKILPYALDGDKGYVEEAMGMSPFGSDDSVQGVESQPEASCWAGGLTIGSFGHWKKPSSLGSYVKLIDAETLMRYTTIRSMEAVSIIQKHTQALFGRRDVAIIPNIPMWTWILPRMNSSR